MDKLNDISKTISAMPLGSLVAIVILAGFALAAYAIYAVTKVAKERD